MRTFSSAVFITGILLRATRGRPFLKAITDLTFCETNTSWNILNCSSHQQVLHAVNKYLWFHGFYVHVVLEPGAETHDKRRPGLFCLCLFISNAFYFLIFFFICCPQSHISHYYVRSVFPHCNGSKLHKSPNPARPLRLAQKICQHLQKKNQQKKQSQLSVLYKQDQPVSYPIHRSVRLIWFTIRK